MDRCAFTKVNGCLDVHLSRWVSRKVDHLPRVQVDVCAPVGGILEAAGALSRSLWWSTHLSGHFEYWQLMEHSCLHLGTLPLVMEPPTQQLGTELSQRLTGIGYKRLTLALPQGNSDL